MKPHLSLSALSIAALITLAGCGTDNSEASGQANPEQRSTMEASPGPSVAVEHSSEDVMFVQTMIPHHRQAIEMSEIMLAKGGIDPQITELAERIRDAQAAEIDTMTNWLEAWGEPVEMPGGSAGMETMMTGDQMAELESAEGDEASRLFLTEMTTHHKGAVDMAQQEAENGTNPDVVALARKIVETQQAEIEKMNSLLAEL